MNRFFLPAIVLIAISVGGCSSTAKNEQAYGAAGGAAGAALCSKQQNLLGLCVIGGYILGSKFGAAEDAAKNEKGETECKTVLVSRLQADQKTFRNEEVVTCKSKATTAGFRNYPILKAP